MQSEYPPVTVEELRKKLAPVQEFLEMLNKGVNQNEVALWDTPSFKNPLTRCIEIINDITNATLSQKAKYYATKCHEMTNHMYDNHAYSFHLAMVVNVAKRHIHLIPKQDHETVLAACWAHDVIEDTRQTYNDVKAVLGERVADIVFAVTNEKGKVRSERANDKYYDGIRQDRLALFVKLCDKTANVMYSREKSGGSRMYQKYQQEHPHFEEKLGIINGCEYSELQEYLRTLLQYSRHSR